MFACNLRSMKLPLSHRGFLPVSVSAFRSASVSISALSSGSQSQSLPLNCCKCDAREMKMSTLALPRQSSSRGSSGHQRQLSCGGSRNCGSGISNFTQCLITCGLLLLLAAGNAIVEGALQNVNLIIEPPAVRRGQHAIVRCLYELEGTPLYSAKFYRGQLEFYRYTPGEFPNTKVFPFPGIHVDVTNSNATQVLIRNVGFGLSGNFSCEVTADAPLFSTATATGIMQVVELPEKRPQLFTEHTRYEPGDVLRANCSTPPSRPRAELKFTINNMVVGTSETQYVRTIDNLMASRISLKLQLQGIHFSSANPSLLHAGSHGYGGYNGGSGSSFGSGYGGTNSVHGLGGGMSVGSLVLRCTAQISDLYQEYKEIELGTPQRDPVPARVTLSSGSSMTNFFSSYFSSSSRRYTPPTATSVLLMAVATIIATTATPTILAATTTTTMFAAATELCIAVFALFNQMAASVHKLSGKYAEQQQQNEQQLQMSEQKGQHSKNLCRNRRHANRQHLQLPSQWQLLQNYVQRQQQQLFMYAFAFYRAVSAPTFIHR